MLFYNILILFWGCTRTCSHAWWFENRIIFHIFSLLQYLSPQPDTNDSISSGFDEGPPSEKPNVLWLVSCPSALWLANSLDVLKVRLRQTLYYVLIDLTFKWGSNVFMYIASKELTANIWLQIWSFPVALCPSNKRHWNAFPLFDGTIYSS